MTTLTIHKGVKKLNPPPGEFPYHIVCGSDDEDAITTQPWERVTCKDCLKLGGEGEIDEATKEKDREGGA